MMIIQYTAKYKYSLLSSDQIRLDFNGFYREKHAAAAVQAMRHDML